MWVLQPTEAQYRLEAISLAIILLVSGVILLVIRMSLFWTTFCFLLGLAFVALLVRRRFVTRKTMD